MFHKKQQPTLGQALVEFALIATVMLMIIFLVVEASRILWGWITVQNAAREGVRYAITGQQEIDCPVEDLPKFVDKCDIDMRVASIIDATHEALSGLPLNELSGTFEDDNYYIIEVWGVNEQLAVQPDYAGIPNQPVIVRVIYRVPIITPFFRPILESIPVFGQSVLNNEPFGNLGGTGQSAGPPPQIPPLPTPGVTPSFTPTPTLGPTPSHTPTSTSTSTSTPLPCPVQFRGALVAGTTSANVTANYDNNGVNYVVEFWDISPSTPVFLGTATMFPNTGAPLPCPGVGSTNALNQPLIAGHLIQVLHPDGSSDEEFVQQGTSTYTPSPTFTQTPTPSPSASPTLTSTVTPSAPYIIINPACGFPPSVTINILGANWPTNKAVSFFYDGNPVGSIPAGHSGAFTFALSRSGTQLSDGNHIVMASAVGNISDSETFVVPCVDITVTPSGNTPTFTPAPADLVIVGQPVLVSTPPIVAYQPVDIQVAITNTGEIAVNQQFFVDIFFDPTVVYSDHIPIDFSSGYVAVGSLAGGASQVITITAPNGFSHIPPHLVYGMVDSLQDVGEVIETNNVSLTGLPVSVTPANSPTPSVTPGGSDTIAGVVRSFQGGWVPQFRAQVGLYNGTSYVSVVETDENGVYSFNNVDPGVYTVYACLDTDQLDFVGVRSAVSPPNSNIHLYISADPAGCPIP